MKIVVASTNPVKINAVQQAFTAMFPDVKVMVEGCSPQVDLPAQPMSSLETKSCAIARVDAIVQQCPAADMWAAIEGGIEVNEKGETECLAWIVMRDKHNRWGESRTATFALPQSITRLIAQGMELGHANDQIFNMHNSKQNLGMTGTVTQGVIDRTTYYTHAAILALVPFRNADIYFDDTKNNASFPCKRESRLDPRLRGDDVKEVA